MNQKFAIAVLLSLVFVMLSVPQSFIFTDSIIKPFNIRTTFDNCQGIPTLHGTIVHAIIFCLITSVLLMYKNDFQKAIKEEKENVIEI